jgi:hypothetical protein
MEHTEITEVAIVDDFEILTVGDIWERNRKFFVNFGDHSDDQREYVTTNHPSYPTWNDAYDAAFAA